MSKKGQDAVIIYEANLKIAPEKEELNEYKWLNDKVRRYAVIDDLPPSVGDGAFGTVRKCMPVDGKGKRVACSHQLVIKFARIDYEYNGTQLTQEQIRNRLSLTAKNNEHEYKHVRRRILHGSKCLQANPIIDRGILEEGRFDVPFTVQRYLSEANDLDDWLWRNGFRTIKALTKATGRFDQSKQNWQGFESLSEWLDVCIPIAESVAELHMRRVTHGDIHPGNVFLTRDKQNPLAIIIDFGESRLFLPAYLQHRDRKRHQYLAPEVAKPCNLNEKIDVYAFGKVAMYLAHGFEPILNHGGRRHEHRDQIDKLLSKSGHQYINEEPRILDLIGRATSHDPADRPRMFDIVRDLNLMRSIPPKASFKLSFNRPLAVKLSQMGKSLTKLENQHPLFASLLSLEVEELAHALDGLRTEMVQFTGTRDHALRMLIAIYDSLKKGDSWSSATTLDLWQHHALGCNGAYDSANIRAAKRGVAINRAFIVSVEEVGERFATRFLYQLRRAKGNPFSALAEQLHTAIEKYTDAKKGQMLRHPVGKQIEPKRKIDSNSQQARAGRLYRITDSFAKNVSRWSLDGRLNSDSKFDPHKATKVAFSLCIQGSVEDVVRLRQENPLSIVHFADSSKHILVATDAQGRRTGSEPRDLEKSVGTDGDIIVPHLLGVRVHVSVENEDGKPSDRLQCMHNLFLKDSVNIASLASNIAEMIQSAMR